MKKLLAMLLVLTMLVCACAPAAPAPEAEAAPTAAPAPTPTAEPAPEPTAEPAPALFAAGAYSAASKGQNGDVAVTVTFSETAIESVEVTAHAETRGIGDYAIRKIPAVIVENQTLAVDTMTGATVTRAALLAAVADCITQAGADPAAFQTPVKDAIDVTEYTCDVVVAGAGAAGLSAAYEAALAGAKVIVVEKQAIPGGSTARSGGAVLAAGTRLQASLGVEDTPEAFAQFIIDRGEGMVNEEKILKIAQNSSSTIDWLESLGATFAPELQELHRSIKPDRTHSAKEQAGIGSGAGGELTDVLYQACLDLGVTFLFETPAESLIFADGAVQGVNARFKDGTAVTVKAKSSLLATGGFDQNKEYTQKYTPKAVGNVTQVPNGNMGDGLRMAEEVGAKIVAGGGAVTLTLDMTTGSGETGGLFVLQNAQRFMDESAFWFVRTKTLMDLNETAVYFITDVSSDSRGIYPMMAEYGKIAYGDSPEALAEKLGLDPETLAKTVYEYNEMCEKGEDTLFGKDAAFMKPVDTTALYGIAFNSTSSGTFGGPVTDLDGRVLAADDTVIPGLYAAGEVANGDILWQEYPGSGTSLCICFTFGRIAGRTAAQDVL